MILGVLSGVKSDGKNTRELIDMKWANGSDEALKQAVGEFSFLLLDPK
jgi:hypothetical protein